MLQHTVRTTVVLLLVATLTSSCSGGINPLGFLKGSGTNVAANTQVGQNNYQTLGKSETYAPTVALRPNSKVDTVDQSTTESKVSTDKVDNITINEIPAWVILLLVLGWLLPSPQEISRGVWSLIRLRTKRENSK